MAKKSLSQKIGMLNSQLEFIKKQVKETSDHHKKTALLVQARTISRKIQKTYSAFKNHLNLSPS